MLRMVDFKQVNNILSLSGSDAISPKDRCIWKKLAKEKGADETELNKSPFDTWTQNRLIPVNIIKQSITYYTITFVDDDTTTVLHGPYQLEENARIEKPSTNPTKVDPEGKKVYEFTGWALSTDTTKHLGTDIKYAKGNYTFVAEYNGKDVSDGNVRTMDNMGQIENYSKNKPESSKSGDIGVYWTKSQNGWFSGPHDGDQDDVMGIDGGISPSGASTGRHQVTKDGVSYTWYTWDSVIYEFLSVQNDREYSDGNALNKTTDQVVESELLTEWIGRDSNGNEVMHIKSLNPWIKFAILRAGEGYNITVPFYDPSGTNETTTVNNVPVSILISYFIQDNTNAASRVGKVQVTTSGGDCSYVASQWAPNNKYMTDGRVYFYQLGTNYTSV